MPPGRCASDGCKSRTFEPLRMDGQSLQCVAWQKVRLQELLGSDKQQQGQVRAKELCAVSRVLWLFAC